MMRKRLSKKIWYGSDVDSDGKPVIPPLAKDPEDLEGLHYGELYLHIADDKLSLWTRTLTDQIKQIGGEGSGGELWQLKETENGEKYIFSAFDVATQKGITMYANGGMLDLPSIYDGLPLDNKTIWFNPETKLIEVIGSSSEGDEGGFADFSNVMESGTGNAYTSFVLSEDGKGLTFVKGETFAKQSDYEALNNKVADFLEGSDTDEIINKWKELETFLSGMKESDDLSDILSTKWTKDDAKIANWDTAFGWGDHSKAGYMKKEVIYDESIGCWKLVGDLLVTGGITMFANDGTYTPSTITDAVNIDGNTLVRVNGVIMLNPDIEFGGGVAESVAWSDVTEKPTWIGNNKPSYTTKEVSEETNLYFTNERAVSALSDTLKDYLPLTGGIMTGTIQSQVIRPKTSNYYSLGTFSYLWSNVYTKLATIDGIEIKKSASGVLFIDGNLVVSGGITMYGTDGTTAPSIWDGAPVADTRGGKGVASFDPNYFTVDNGVVKFIGQIGGGIESITKQMVLDALGYTPYNSTNPNGYITSAGSITGNASTATKVKVNTSSSNTTFPILFTDTKQAATSGSNGSIYCDTASGAGYNPSTNTFVGNGVTLGNGVSASIKTKGWYRFATTINAENVAGGSLIFSIRRQYYNYKTESHIIAVSVGYSSVTFTQIAGAPSDALITKVRATNTKDGVIYFDFYYGVDTTSTHNVYVNCIGSASLQTPASTTQLLSYVTEFDLVNGFKSNAIHFTILNNLGYLRSKCGKNLLVGGDNLSGGTAYAFAGYSYDSAVKVNRTYRLTICGKLGENTSHIYAYWDGGSGNNTYIGGLSKTEERIITVRAKITNKGSSNRLVFYKFNSSNTQETTSYSYIRWAYLEEEFQEGELSTTTDYNTWLTEYNKRDTKTFLHKIQRLNVGESYWSADAGMKIDNENAYAVVMKRTKDSGGTFIRMFANNQSTQSWASGVNNTHQFSWWYQNGTSDTQKMYLDSSGKLVVSDSVEAGGMFNIQSTGTYHRMRLFTDNSNNYANGGATFLQAGNYAGTSTKGSLFISGINVADLSLCKIYGPLLVTSGITMYSDERKKTILNHVELSLKEVADAPLIEHYYNSDEAKTTHVGSVAQYWAKLNDWFCKEDGEGFLTMEIQNAALASAISVARELTRYESKTDKQIKKLKKRIGELEEEIENLKNK